MTPRQRQSKLKEGSLDRKTPHEADAYVTTFLSLLSLTATDNLPWGRLIGCLGSQRMADACLTSPGEVARFETSRGDEW